LLFCFDDGFFCCSEIFRLMHSHLFIFAMFASLTLGVRPQIPKTILRKKNKVGGITPLDFKLSCKVTVIKTLWYWHKCSTLIRSETPEINWHVYGQLITKEQIIQWRKDSLFNKWCWEYWTASYKRIKPNHCLIPNSKNNSERLVRM